MSSTHNSAALFDLLVPLATSSVCVVNVPKLKGSETYAHVVVPDLEPIVVHTSPRGGRRSQAARTIIALATGLHRAIELRSTHAVLEVDDPHVRGMLRGDYVSRATHREWAYLQQAIGRASAFGTRVYSAGVDGLVRLGELLLE
ncbi:MAG: hypothetical protein ACHREM_14850 [Polyangiales bacterium]